MKKNRILPIAVAVALSVLAIVYGSRFRVAEGISVSFDAEATRPFVCQVFFIERVGEPFQEAKSRSILIPEGPSRAVFVLPTVSLTSLRIDFGSDPVAVRLGRIRVSGKRTIELDWNDFGVRNGLDRFDVGKDGTLSLEAGPGDPFAIYVPALAAEGRSLPNSTALAIVLFAGAGLWWVLAGPGGLLRNAVPRPGETLFSPPFLILALLLVFARLALSSRLPPFFGASDWDDVWFVRSAGYLGGLDWLGPYDDHTLIKGCFGPAVLAFCAVTGLTFHAAETLLYLLGCAFFLAIVSRLVRNRPLLLALFALLLFNPISFSLSTWQRIYRNGMVLWQVPLAFGFLFLTFLESGRDGRKTVVYAVLSGLVLWMFQNTREDGIWIWPFALVCMFCAGARAWRSAKIRRSGRIAGIVSCILPVVVFAAGNGILCLINWRVYGVPIRNDRDAGNYAKAMQDLFLIEPDAEDDARLSGPEHEGHYHSIYYSTLCKAYETSPTLNGARREIDAAIDAWAGFDKYAERNLKMDHMLFAIRRGVFAAGHYVSLAESEAFFGAVHKELSAAFRDGRISRRGLSVSALVAPFRAKHVPLFLKEWKSAIRSAVENPDAGVRLIGLEEPGRYTVAEEAVPLFERMTGSRMVARADWPPIEPYVARANSVAAAYSAFLPWAALLFLFGHACLSLLVCVRAAAVRGLFDWWLFATGILLSFLLHTACIAFVSATTFPATGYGYLASSGQLVLMFVCVVAAIFTKVVVRVIGERTEGAVSELTHDLLGEAESVDDGAKMQKTATEEGS